MTRKSFLALMATYSWVAGVTLAFVGALRAGVPSVLPDPSKRFKIGKAREYTPGLSKAFADESTVVFSDDDGLYAMSMICTHLGCIVMRSQDGFQCPCHGSKFARDGKVLKGPAPRDLDWYAVDRTPSGQLIVDRAKVVRRGTKLRLDRFNA